jgi:hypothetical protein
MTVMRAAVNFQTGESFEEQLEFALSTCPKDIRIKIKRIFAESLQIKDDQINNLLEEIAKYKPIALPPLGKTSSSKYHRYPMTHLCHQTREKDVEVRKI